jgi:hypothetical protein
MTVSMRYQDQKSSPQQKIGLFLRYLYLGQVWLERVTAIYSGFQFSEAQ